MNISLILKGLSSDSEHAGEELIHLREFKEPIADLKVSVALGKVAVCGEGSIKLHELHDVKVRYEILLNKLNDYKRNSVG